MKLTAMTRRLVKTLLMMLVASAGVKAQDKPLENSLLWAISGNGLEKPSYLYGTIHMICESDFRISDKVKKAFDSSAKLVLEIDMFDPAVAAEMQKAIMADTPLSAKLTPARFAQIDTLLQQHIGLSLQEFDNFKLVALTSILGRFSYTCDSLKVYESEFKERATARNMPVGSLETLQEQMGFFAKAFPDDSILAQLTTLDLEEMRAETAQLVAYYRAEELEKVYKNVIQEKGMSNTALYWLLEARNANWAEIMPGMMKERSIFFAVGAGHLAGANGIIRLLRGKGYTVKPVLH